MKKNDFVEFRAGGPRIHRGLHVFRQGVQNCTSCRIVNKLLISILVQPQFKKEKKNSLYILSNVEIIMSKRKRVVIKYWYFICCLELFRKR